MSDMNMLTTINILNSELVVISCISNTLYILYAVLNVWMYGHGRRPGTQLFNTAWTPSTQRRGMKHTKI